MAFGGNARVGAEENVAQANVRIEEQGQTLKRKTLPFQWVNETISQLSPVYV